MLSASQPPSVAASKRKVLAAWASSARGVRRAAISKASNLKGTVTLQPLAPALTKSVSVAGKSSSGHSRRSYTMACPVCWANCVWISGERLWAIGLPATA